MGVFGQFSVLKLDLLTTESIHQHEDLGGECSTKCEYFHLLFPGIHAFPPNAPLSQKSVIFRYFGKWWTQYLEYLDRQGKNDLIF